MRSFLKAAPDWSVDGADWPLRETSAFVDSSYYHWHVQRCGRGARALLLHGTGASAHSYAGLAPCLSDRFELLAVDLPGHGFTRAAAYRFVSLETVAADVAALLRDLDYRPSLIIGHSAGAAIMMQLIVSGAVDPTLAVSINGALRPFEGMAGLVLPVAARALHFNPFSAFLFARAAEGEERVRRLIAQTGSDPMPQIVWPYARLLSRPGHVAGALAMMAHWDLGRLERRMPSVATASLLIAGLNDKAVPPADAAAFAVRIGDGASVSIEGLGHLAHEEAPDRIAALILDYIDARGGLRDGFAASRAA